MKHYTYAWLREDKTPYYIGKGQNNRAWVRQRRKNSARPPHDDSRIIILKRFETHEEALLHERYMIHIFGRKDYGNGILHNHSEGGEGTSGYKHTPEQIEKQRIAMTGKVQSDETRKKRSESLKKAYAEGRRVMTAEHKEKLIAASKLRKGTTRYNDGLTHQQRWVLNNKEKRRQQARDYMRRKRSSNEESSRGVQ